MESLAVTTELTAAVYSVLKRWKKTPKQNKTKRCFRFPTAQLGPAHPLREAAVPVGEVWLRVTTVQDLLQ